MLYRVGNGWSYGEGWWWSCQEKAILHVNLVAHKQGLYDWRYGQVIDAMTPALSIGKRSLLGRVLVA